MDNYEDIINMPHYVSQKHKQMPMSARAAQFAPFAALNGYGNGIKETVKLSNDAMELLDKNEKIEYFI